MATNFDFNVSPYYDDYDDSTAKTGSYHRVLYRPGRGVQARELTTQQQIMQRQVERFGEHVFEQGSQVSGAQFSLSNPPYIKLEAQYSGSDITVSNFDSKTFFGKHSLATGRVIKSVANTSTEPNTIFMKYNSGNRINTLFLTGTITGTFLAGEKITGGTSTKTGIIRRWDSTNKILWITESTGTFTASETITATTGNGTDSLSNASGALTATLQQINSSGFLEGEVIQNDIPTLTCSAVTGTFQVGDVITGSSSSAKGQILNFDSGAKTIQFVGVSGTFTTSDTVTSVGTAGGFKVSGTASGTVSAVANLTATYNATVGGASGSAITSSVGKSQLFSIQEGVFFVNGFFVKCGAQTIILSKYTNNSSKRIGLVVTESTVDSDTDTTLVDNAQGYSNQNAAGADRYKIELTLTALDTTATTGDENFITLTETSTTMYKKLENIPVYSEIFKSIARRTNDESGSYIVEDFPIELTDHASDTTKMVTKIGIGKAYVHGFERQKNVSTSLALNRARTTETRTSGDTLTQWGNYVIVDGMSGASAQDFFDPTVIDVVDLHCTEYGDITVTSAETYRDTFIGTARVRHVRHDDSSNDPADSSTPGSETYRMYLYDFKFHSILGTAQAGAAGSITLASGEDDTDDALNGAQIEIYGGTGSGQARVIKDYVGSTKVATPDVNWTTNPASDSTYRISFGLKNVQSVVKVTTYDSTSPTAPILAAKANIANSGRVGSVARKEVYTPTAGGAGADGDAKLFDTEHNTLVWKVGEGNINEITEDSVSYTIQRKFTDQAISSGAFSITAPANEEFFSGSSALSNSLKNSDYLVVVTAVSAAGSTSLAVGDIIDYTASGRSITPNETNRTVTFEANDGSLGATVDVICKMTIGEGAAAEPKSKAISDFIHLKNVIIDTNNNNIASLGYSDIDASSVAIYDQSAISSSSPGTDVTSRFEINTGQKDNVYDHGFIRLKVGQTDPGEVNVKFKRYAHSGNGYFSANSYGGITRGDIETFTSPTTGRSIKLVDCIDFIPRRPDEAYTTLSSADTDGQARIDRREFVTTFGTATGGSASTIVLESNTSKTSATDDRYNGAIVTIISGTGAGQVRRVHDYTGSSRTVTVDCDFDVNAASGSVYRIEQIEYTKANVELPYPNTNWTADYKYYLPRKDILFMLSDGTIAGMSGEPELNPKVPVLPDNVMPLYQLAIPAYTNSVSDVNVYRYDNKRYTMRDIGKLEKRIDHLEYYTSLSLLEKTSETMSVKDDQGHDRFKNGILVDNFTGHGVGDVGHIDHKVSIDPVKTEMRPPFSGNVVDLSSAFDSGTSSGVTKTGNLITLAYTTEDFISQPMASKGVNLNPFLVLDYVGSVVMSPDYDAWFDTGTNPTVHSNVNGDYDAWQFASTTGFSAFGTLWKDWEILVHGLDLNNLDNVDSVRQSIDPTGEVFANSDVTAADLVRTVHSIKQRNTSHGIGNKNTFQSNPDSMFSSSGDGRYVVDMNVSPYIRALTITITAFGLKPNSRHYPYFDGTDVSSTCTPSGGSAGDPIYTDANGGISGLSFALAAGTFRTGIKLLRLLNVSTESVKNSTSRAEAIFQATGISGKRVAFAPGGKRPYEEDQNWSDDNTEGYVFDDEIIFANAFGPDGIPDGNDGNADADPIAASPADDQAFIDAEDNDS